MRIGESDALKILDRATRKLGVKTSTPPPDEFAPTGAGRPDGYYPAEVPWSHEPHAVLQAPWLPEIVAWVYGEQDGSYAIDHRELAFAQLLASQRPGLTVLVIFIGRDKVITVTDPGQVFVAAHENSLAASSVQGANWPKLTEIIGPPVRSSLALAR